MSSSSWHTLVQNTDHFKKEMKPILKRVSQLGMAEFELVVDVLIHFLGEDIAITLAEDAIEDPDEVSSETKLAQAREAYAMPGALPAHTRLCPLDRSSLKFQGPPALEEPLNVPPDGLCAIYAYLAATDIGRWQSLQLDELGFISDAEEEVRFREQAKTIRSQIEEDMRQHGDHDMALHLATRYPGMDEFGYYAAAFGGSFIVTYLSHPLPSMIHGFSEFC